MTTPTDAIARPDALPDNPPAPDTTRVVGHRDSPASSGPDLAGLFNAFLASLGGQLGPDDPAEDTPLGRFAGHLSESLRKGLDERARAPGVTPEARAQADRHAKAGLGFIHENK